MMEEKCDEHKDAQVISSLQKRQEMSLQMADNANAESGVSGKCSICLGDPMVDATNLDGCSHKFCFPCITEWIKLRPICPMCKRPVSKVFHHAKGGDNKEDTAEEVTVITIQKLAVRQRIEADSVRPLTLERAHLVCRIRHLQRLVRLHDETFHNGLNFGISEIENRRREYVDRISRYQMLLDNWERPRREIISDPTFRVLVYDLQLRRVPLVSAANVTSRRTGISPQYFRNNEGSERARISEFVRRELTALVPALPNLENIVDLVYDLAMTDQIMSPAFTSYLSSECCPLVNHIDHFVELLYEFAVSGHDLILFDLNSEYISREEYRNRLTSMGGVAFRDNPDNDILIELGSMGRSVRNGASPQVLAPTFASSPAFLRTQLTSAYADALISLRRLLLVLDTADEVIPTTEETALGEAIQAIVQSFVQYRNRLRNRREHSGRQAEVRQSDNCRSEIVLSDSNSDSEEGLSNVVIGENSQATTSRINLCRGRSENLRHQSRPTSALTLRLRQRLSRSPVDSFRRSFFNNLPMGRSQQTRETLTGILSGNVTFSPLTATRAITASMNDSVIDLGSCSTHDDDDVMVVSESTAEAKNINGSDDNDDDVVIETGPGDLVVVGNDNRSNTNSDNIVLNEEV